MSASTPRVRRNPQFDLLRILFASLVLLAHAPELTDGNRNREILSRLTRGGLTFGDLAVDGFFLLSGYLIVQSWLREPALLSYLRKRLLRIVPGYLVAALLSVLVVGLVAPGIPHFFRHLDWHFPVTLVLLQVPITPPVLPGLPYAVPNGSLWTIFYEFQCYLLIALAGLCGLLRRRLSWVVFTAAVFFVWVTPGVRDRLTWHHFLLITGQPRAIFRLVAIYAIGTSFYLFRDHIPFRPMLAWLAGLVIVVSLLRPTLVEPALVLCGGYLMFYLASLNLHVYRHIPHFPDISYGIYLYGWPVEVLWIWFFRGSPWITFAAALVLCMLLGWLSWRLVESPMLRLKRRPAARPATLAV